MKAIWNNKVIAESDDTLIVEGNHYFPPESLKDEFFTKSESTSLCAWKGCAEYFNVVVDGKENKDAAWFYSNPNQEVANIAGRVAFWRGVEVV